MFWLIILNVISIMKLSKVFKEDLKQKRHPWFYDKEPL